MLDKNKKIYAMACAVINGDGKILLLKRAPNKKLAPNKWFVVGAAPLKIDENMEFIAHREMMDELGVDGQILVRMSRIRIREGNAVFMVSPFLAQISNQNIKLNSEHTEYRFVHVDDLKNYDLVEKTELMIRELLKLK